MGEGGRLVVALRGDAGPDLISRVKAAVLTQGRIELRELVRRTAEDHRSTLEGRGVTLRVDVAEQALWADADPTRVAQIIGNLLQNAVKFEECEGL